MPIASNPSSPLLNLCTHTHTHTHTHTCTHTQHKANKPNMLLSQQNCFQLTAYNDRYMHHAQKLTYPTSVVAFSSAELGTGK